MAHFWRTQEYQVEVAQRVEEDANLIAEHIVQLGGMADGTAQVVARRTALDAYWLATAQVGTATSTRFRRRSPPSSDMDATPASRRPN
jgi:DNA-binding ferritin-like protein